MANYKASSRPTGGHLWKLEDSVLGRQEEGAKAAGIAPGIVESGESFRESFQESSLWKSLQARRKVWFQQRL